jgi:hypothetical protein
MWWRSIEMEAPAERVWDILVDLDRWPEWGPTVSGARLDGPGRRLGPAASGAVRTLVGLWVPFTLDRWIPEREWSWRVAGVPATSHRVRPMGPSRCCAELGVPAWAPPYLLVCELALRRLAALAES